MSVRPETIEETAVWWAITGTYVFFLLGSLYVLAPAMAWLLALARLLRESGTRAHGTLPAALPPAVWIWFAGMLAMALALLVAHADFGLGLGQTVKSSIGWAKGWALLALFPLIGCMSIRPQLLYRAACLLAAQTLLVLPLAVAGYLAGLPEVLYVSPLQAVGGPGPEFFDVSVYSINPDTGTPRWRLFTPWGPALGFVGAVYFFLALAEPNRAWRLVGVTGALAMVVASGSRLGLVAIPSVLCASWIVANIRRPGLHVLAAAACLLAGIFGLQVHELLDFLQEQFHAARPDSSRVRATLARIATDRWLEEAVIWGHGVVEKGPHLVEFMPIGSHHTWYGLLLVKGAVGFAALALPMGWTAAALLGRARSQPETGTALRLLLLLFVYSFGENLEILAYLFWPALVMIGIALRRASAPAAAARVPAVHEGALA